MKRRFSIFALALCITLSIPAVSMAASHGSLEIAMHENSHSSDMQSGMAMDHNAGMNMASSVVFSETMTVDGVKAEAQLLDTSEAMAKAGMEATHHLMLNFTNEHDGAAIDSGVVAVKVTSPTGEESPAIKMMGMEGGFGADLTLKQPGAYTFTLGTKLADEQKRQFVFHVDVK